MKTDQQRIEALEEEVQRLKKIATEMDGLIGLYLGVIAKQAGVNLNLTSEGNLPDDYRAWADRLHSQIAAGQQTQIRD
jgi:hypothetical protein